MEGFGIDKLLLILVIVLVLFGARRVPEIGGSIGKGIREFKRGMRELGDDPPSEPKLPNASADALAPRPDESRPEPTRLLS